MKKAFIRIFAFVLALCALLSPLGCTKPGQPVTGDGSIPEIANTEKYKNVSALTKSEIDTALDYIISKIDEALPTFTDKYPSASSTGLKYKQTDNRDWTNSFWTGMLWLAYEYTGDEKYRTVAEAQCEDFRKRLDESISLDHHDIGFLYTLSCVLGYQLTGNARMRETAILAADKLLNRYHEKGGFLQAWGTYGAKENYRLIIDCMMNLELLYWASEETGDLKYYDIAYTHAKTTESVIIRPDSSTYHTYYFDMATGEPTKGVTAQGSSDDSAWARGQAWGIYGFYKSYAATGDKRFLDAGCRVTNYFINHLPADDICYWDLIYTDGSGEERDSSAAAIAVCGLIEYSKLDGVENAELYGRVASSILRSLTSGYTTAGADSNGILLHGVYSKPGKSGVDECLIWGDYYYMEALMKLRAQSE